MSPPNGQHSRPLILILVDRRWNDIHQVTFELLGDGRRMALVLNARLEVVLLTSSEGSKSAIRDLRPYLGEKLHLVEHALLGTYTTGAYIQALEALLKSLSPRILMIGATANGRDLGPRLAARLRMGYLPNCLMFKAGEHGRLEITRVSHGGRVHNQTVWPIDAPVIITMKPGVADAPSPQATPGELVIQRHEVNIQRDRVRVIDRLPANPKTQDIREAERIVAGGRGVGGSEGFGLVRELADALSAAVGASRVAVDLGWIEYPRQVGQTGKTVSPKLYFAVGISGASHHLMGMLGSEKMVAVNTDKQAPIFSVCHLGAVGDLHQILPRLTEKIRRHKTKAKTNPQEMEGVPT